MSKYPSIIRPMFGAAQILLMVTLFGCSGSEAPAPKVPAPDLAATPLAPKLDTPCLASSTWITSPSEPAEVAASESFCDFYQFSWQWFLAQVSPANPADPAGDRVFETNRLLDPAGSPGQCTQSPISGRLMAGKKLALRVNKPEDFETEQADGLPLYDQDGNILYYNVWYSPEECNATATGFVAGTMELKIAWRILDNPDPTYFTMSGDVPDGSGSKTVTLGMVGFHLVNWTSAHPEMIWATFEHKSNAPLCDGSSAASGWSLTSDAAAKCLVDNPQTAPGMLSANCAQYDFNNQAQPSGDPSPTGTADEICRLYANGNEPNPVNGNDSVANLASIQQLNAALVGPTGLLTQLQPTDPMAIWQNYEMVGGLWTKGGAASGDSPVAHSAQVGTPPVTEVVPGDTTSPQRGSLQLTNMTMETYEQGQQSFVPNCFGCHNYVPTSPADPGAPLQVSHIATQLLLPTSTVAATKAAGDAGAK
jgi:hypothetical protein